MNSGRSAGFTIIETMLFLAVSGLLAIGVLTGAGYSINIQRYRDANVSLVSYLQGTYDAVMNVNNERTESQRCTSANKIETGSPGDLQYRGTSDCTIVGRIIRTTDGRNFTSSAVLAANDQVVANNDVESLIQSDLFVDDAFSPPETYLMEWGTRLMQPGGTTPITQLSILVVRSPFSGAVRTYTSDLSSAMPNAMVSGSPLSTDLNLCIDPSGMPISNRGGAVIYQNAASTSSVKQIAPGVC